jgi:hypothetical protein
MKFITHKDENIFKPIPRIKNSVDSFIEVYYFPEKYYKLPNMKKFLLKRFNKRLQSCKRN